MCKKNNNQIKSIVLRLIFFALKILLIGDKANIIL